MLYSLRRCTTLLKLQGLLFHREINRFILIFDIFSTDLLTGIANNNPIEAKRTKFKIRPTTLSRPKRFSIRLKRNHINTSRGPLHDTIQNISRRKSFSRYRGDNKYISEPHIGVKANNTIPNVATVLGLRMRSNKVCIIIIYALPGIFRRRSQPCNPFRPQ